MEGEGSVMDHRKRRRRRRKLREPIAATFILTSEVKGEVGAISKDLFHDCSGAPNDSFRQKAGAQEEIRYVAISPWSPVILDQIEEASWSILPVSLQRPDGDESASTLKVSLKSQTFNSFIEALQCKNVKKCHAKGAVSCEIRIVDVQPLVLDTVFVSIDGDALDRHDDVQARFGGGFVPSKMNGSIGKGKGKGRAALDEHGPLTKKPEKQEDRITAAVRDALKCSRVVHQDDLLQLPLPTHPITHVPLPPAKITLCEPVGQGLVGPSTRIVVNRDSHVGDLGVTFSSGARQSGLDDLIAAEDDGNPNESYYSALEDGRNGNLTVSELEEYTSDDESSSNGSGSDSSTDNIITMDTPALATMSSGMHSSITAATPRANSHQAAGIKTPGSVFSNYTAATARSGQGGLFTSRGLLNRVPDELLHPRPAADEDEEARIFVDVKMLLRLGCFSGDWVKVAVSQRDARDHWGLHAFKEDNGEMGDFRAMKVYGLPDLASTTAARYMKNDKSSKRSSSNKAHSADRSPAEAWLSPIVLANLDSPKLIRLTPLSNVNQDIKDHGHRQAKPKISSSMYPPVAKELTLRSISTPLSTELALQSGLMAAIKYHFHYKRRILQQGDLLAVTLDVAASRLLAQASVLDGNADLEQLLTARRGSRYTSKGDRGVIWYKVAHISPGDFDNENSSENMDVWGGALSIELGNTRMAEAGRDQSKIPNTESGCDYYLGQKASPKTSTDTTNSAVPVKIAPRPYTSPLRRRIRELMAASTSPRAIHFKMDPIVVLLHSTQRNTGKATLVSRAAADIGNHVFSIDAYDLVTEGAAGGGDVKTEAIFQARIERALSCGAAYTVILLRHIEALTADRMAAAFRNAISQCRVMLATTTEIDKIPDSMRGLFTHELEVAAPDEGERENLLRDIIQERGIRIAHDVDLAAIAVKSAALVAGDLVDIVERAIVAREDRLDNILHTNSATDEGAPESLVRDILVSGGYNARCVTGPDFTLAVDAARKNFADAIGAPKIPNVSWDDVGGLSNVKDAVMETIQLPLERPELFAKGMKKRSGILFYGPPGTGKTLLAKAIATEFSLNFFSVKGPELLNMYIGESEANVRRVFQRARDARPCVVFFDELDSVAPKRGNQGDSGGVMDRIVSQLLAELDGMSDGEEGTRGGVFVIGATNRPDLLDQALLRPGRFDKMLYLGVSDTHDKQLTILEALTRKFALDPSLDLRRVAESLPFTYTGADLYALASDAMLKAITRQADAVDRKIKALPSGPVTTAYFFDHLATDADIAVMVTEADFEAAKNELVGSVSAKELEHYARVRAAFEGPELLNDKSQRSSHSLPSAPRIGPMPTRAKDKKSILGGKVEAGNLFEKEFNGKGKSSRWDSSEEDDDDAYITSNDFQATPESGRRRSNAPGFQVGSLRDEEKMYE